MTDCIAVPDQLTRTSTVGIRVDAIDSISAVTLNLKLAIQRERAWLMTFANPATAVLAARSPQLREMLLKFDVVAPDGIGMVIAMQMLHRRSATRVSFDNTSLAPSVFRLAVDRSIRVVLIGGTPGVAEMARKRLMLAYPGLQINAAFDGYSNPEEAIGGIIAINPGIVIAGMGAPLQEEFLLKLVARGWNGLGFTCGGFFDQLSLKGGDYYPSWIDKYNIRWAYRFMMEPGRLWRRYLLDYPQFGVRLCGSLLRDRDWAPSPSQATRD